MLIDRKITAFSKKVSDLPDRPGGTMTTAELKAWFDTAPEELRLAVNGMVDDIIAQYASKTDLNGVVLGQIPDGSLTISKQDPGLQAAMIGAQMYTYKNVGGAL